jgi:hypothetical protein
MSWTSSRARTTFTAALLLIAVAGLAVFITSPWHIHNRLSAQPCALTSFEHASTTGESLLPSPIAPLMEAVAIWTGRDPRPVEPTFILPAPVRAPPYTLPLA